MSTLCVQLSRVRDEYHNSKEFDVENDDAFEYNEQFRTHVSMNFSGVHIPVEIYEGGTSQPRRDLREG